MRGYRLPLAAIFLCDKGVSSTLHPPRRTYLSCLRARDTSLSPRHLDCLDSPTTAGTARCALWLAWSRLSRLSRSGSVSHSARPPHPAPFDFGIPGSPSRPDPRVHREPTPVRGVPCCWVCRRARRLANAVPRQQGSKTASAGAASQYGQSGSRTIRHSSLGRTSRTISCYQ